MPRLDNLVNANLSGLDRAAWTMSSESRLPARAPTKWDVEAAGTLLLGCWQVLPVALPRLRQWCGESPFAQDWLQRLEARSLASQELGKLQLVQLKRIALEFAAQNIAFVLLKSTALRFCVYESPEQRCGHDLDVGVARADLDRAAACLQQLGFDRAQWVEPDHRFRVANTKTWSDEVSIRSLAGSVENEHYELGFLVRRQRVKGLSPELECAVRRQLNERPCYWNLLPDNSLTCYVVADVHYGISAEIPIDPLLQSRRTVIFEDFAYPVPRRAWLLFHIVLKLYWEGVQNYLQGGYQYADLCRLVTQLDSDEITHFAGLIEEYRFQAGLHYVMRRLRPEFGVRLNREMEQLLESCSRPDLTLSPSDQNDIGDMWGKLWGMR